MKGGYKLIDFKKVDITEEDVVIDGIFNSINSTTKRVVATNLNIGGFELKELELSVVGDESGYLLQCPFFKIIISDVDGVSCEVFTNDNYSTKKIYCHPIYFNGTRNDGSKFQCCCLIFDNNSSEYDFTSFTNKVVSITDINRGAKIMLSGGGINGSTSEIYIFSHLSYNTNEECITLEGITASGDINRYLNLKFTGGTITTITTFIDGVNAIN